MTMAWIARELNAGVPQTLWRAFWAKREKATIRGTDPFFSLLKPGPDGKRDTSGPTLQALRIGGTRIFYQEDSDDFGAEGTFARVQLWKKYIGDPKGFDELFKTWRKM
jgi:hypothetical protein